MLQVEELHRPGLGPISFSVGPGCCLAVSGPSGAGKSLLLRAIADLDPNDGSVRVNDTQRETISATEWRRLVGLVPAESGWWSDIVGDHFADRPAARSIIGELDLPADALNWQVSRLSTGERQRLALARALLIEPRVLLLDEPTAALDEAATARVEVVLHQQMDTGVILVVVTHDAAQVGRLAQSVLTVKDGQADPPEFVT